MTLQEVSDRFCEEIQERCELKGKTALSSIEKLFRRLESLVRHRAKNGHPLVAFHFC